MYTWPSYCTCVWKRSWDDVAQRGFDGTSKWLPYMAICSWHKSQSPTTKHFVYRCPPHHCLMSIYLNGVDDKESINSLNNRKDMLSTWSTPVRMLSGMNFGCSARPAKSVMVSQQQHVTESVSDEPYGNVVSSSLSVVLAVSELIWALLTHVWIYWPSSYCGTMPSCFDKKNRLLRAITVPAIKRWHED